MFFADSRLLKKMYKHISSLLINNYLRKICLHLILLEQLTSFIDLHRKGHFFFGKCSKTGVGLLNVVTLQHTSILWQNLRRSFHCRNLLKTLGVCRFKLLLGWFMHHTEFYIATIERELIVFGIWFGDRIRKARLNNFKLY